MNKVKGLKLKMIHFLFFSVKQTNKNNAALYKHVSSCAYHKIIVYYLHNGTNRILMLFLLNAQETSQHNLTSLSAFLSPSGKTFLM